jgi:RNA polymerase sigma-70 factor (ECF subfamily)
MAIAAVRSGEALSEEFEELFREHWQLVYRAAYAITGNRQDAEDVLQSIFVKLLQRGISPELEHTPARYLHRAAVNLSLNVLRARKRQKLVGGVEQLEIPARQADEAANESAEFHERLMDAITHLKPRAVEILLLHYKHEYSDAQIAKLLGTSRGTIAVTLYRIRARLRGLLRSTGLPAGASAKAGSDGERVWTPPKKR